MKLTTFFFGPIILYNFNCEFFCLRPEEFEANFEPSDQDCYHAIVNKRINPIAEGLYALIYECDIFVDSILTKIAVKVINYGKHETDSPDEQTVRKRVFDNEIKIIELINNINDYTLPFIYGCIENIETKTGFIFMERFEMTLLENRKKNLVQTDNFSEESIFNTNILLFLQAAYSIGLLHEHGIAHLDIKPGSIMVNSDNLVKIIDFSYAYQVLVEADHPKAKKECSFLDSILGYLGLNKKKLYERTDYDDYFKTGTPYYNDPLLLKENYTPKLESDVYSFGITVIETYLGVDVSYKEQTLDNIKSRDKKLVHKMNLTKKENTSWNLFSKDKTLRSAKCSLIDLFIKIIDIEPEKRPTMRTIATTLENILLMNTEQEKTPS